MHSAARLLACAAILILTIGSMSVRAEHDQAPAPARTVDVTQLGPQRGAKVPEFTLPDQDGRHRSLSSLMGEQGLVLVFSRSADW